MFALLHLVHALNAFGLFAAGAFGESHGEIDVPHRDAAVHHSTCTRLSMMLRE